MAGKDYVIHASHVVYWPANMHAAIRDDINLNGTRNIALAAAKNHLHGFLHASSVAAYDPGYSKGKTNIQEEAPLGNGRTARYYFNSKALSEKILNEIIGPTETRLTLFRIGYVIGPCDDATIPFFRKNAIVHPFIDPRMNFVHEMDVADAFYRPMQLSMPGPFNVVADHTVRLSEFYRMIGAKPLLAPAWLATLVMYVCWRFFRSQIHPSWIWTVLTDCAFSNNHLKETGWVPQYDSVEAIKSAL